MVLSEELCILSSWFLSPVSKNSVLEELRVIGDWEGLFGKLSAVSLSAS